MALIASFLEGSLMTHGDVNLGYIRSCFTKELCNLKPKSIENNLVMHINHRVSKHEMKTHVTCNNI